MYLEEAGMVVVTAVDAEATPDLAVVAVAVAGHAETVTVVTDGPLEVTGHPDPTQVPL